MAVGKELVCGRETDNSYDSYTVEVKRMQNIDVICHESYTKFVLCS